MKWRMPFASARVSVARSANGGNTPSVNSFTRECAIASPAEWVRKPYAKARFCSRSSGVQAGSVCDAQAMSSRRCIQTPVSIGWMIAWP